MKNLKKPFLYLILIIFILPLTAHSKMYMWTDENGVKHYSNTPPPKSANNVQEDVEQKTDEQAYQRAMEQTKRYQDEIATQNQRELEAEAIRAAEVKRQRELETEAIRAAEKAKQDAERQKIERLKKVEEGMSKAEVLQLCGYPDLREVSKQWNYGSYSAFHTDWTYFLDNNKMAVVRFRTSSGKSKVKKIIYK